MKWAHGIKTQTTSNIVSTFLKSQIKTQNNYIDFFPVITTIITVRKGRSKAGAEELFVK